MKSVPFWLSPEEVQEMSSQDCKSNFQIVGTLVLLSLLKGLSDTARMIPSRPTESPFSRDILQLVSLAHPTEMQREPGV